MPIDQNLKSPIQNHRVSKEWLYIENYDINVVTGYEESHQLLGDFLSVSLKTNLN